MRRLRWEAPNRAVPGHPYRDSALLYLVLAGLLVGVTALTGGDVTRSAIVGAALVVAATLYSWWRWRARLRRRPEEE